MVNAVKAVLLVCDPAIHEFVLYLNNTWHKKFVVEDLDETHLLVDASVSEFLQKKIDEKLDENQYKFFE